MHVPRTHRDPARRQGEQESRIHLVLGFMTAILGDGLEEIRAGSVVNCMSFALINIPPTVRAIKSKRGAFSGCSGLTTVILNNRMEEI